jgi:hypothetical protein
VCAQLDAFIKKELMRQLDHNTGAVACIIFATAGTAVLHIFQYSQSIADVLMTFMPLDVSYESNAAGITFKRRMI